MPDDGQRAHQVHRRAGVGVGADHAATGRATRASGVGDQRVDHVAAVGRQAERVDVGRARLGVLAGDAADLDHRHARAVGQHDGHLQQRADVARGCAARCCRRTSRRSRRPAAGTPRRARRRPVALCSRSISAGTVTGGTLSSTVRTWRDLFGVGPARAAGRPGVASASSSRSRSLGRQRRQLGQRVDGYVDGPVHAAQLSCSTLRDRAGPVSCQGEFIERVSTGRRPRVSVSCQRSASALLRQRPA